MKALIFAVMAVTGWTQEPGLFESYSDTHEVKFIGCEVARSMKVDHFAYYYPPERVEFLCDGSQPQQLYLVDCPIADSVQAVGVIYGPVCWLGCEDPTPAWYVVCEPSIFKDGLED